MDGAESVDAEMDAILNDTSGGQPIEQTAPPSPESQTQSSSAALKAGGREWKTPAELAKAYDSLQREYSRKSNEYKTVEPWMAFDKYLKDHPELRTELNSRIKEYNERRNAGQSKATAERASGVSPEIAEKLERLEDAHAKYELRDEMNSLRGRFRVDEAGMREVLNTAMEYERRGISISLEDAYKLSSFGKQREAGADEARAALKAKREGNVGSSSVPHIQPKSEQSWKNGAEWTQSLGAQLDSFGIK